MNVNLCFDLIYKESQTGGRIMQQSLCLQEIDFMLKLYEYAATVCCHFERRCFALKERKRHSRVEALNLVCNCLSAYINYIVNYLLSNTGATSKGLTSVGCKADTQPGLRICWRGQSLHREEPGKTETLRTQSACEVLACSFLIPRHIYERYYYLCATLTTWDWSPYPPFLLPSLHFFPLFLKVLLLVH